MYVSVQLSIAKLECELSPVIDYAVIADDHPIFSQGLRRIVQRVGAKSIAEAASRDELLKVASSPTPDLILLDFVFPGFSGVASIKEMREQFPNSAVVVVSMTDNVETVEQIMATGVNGFISKSVPPQHLEASIKAVLEGDVICQTASNLNEFADAVSEPKLPQRQIDVLICLGRGQTNKEIARELDISPNTVRAHVSALFKTLDVKTRSAAAAAAVEMGVI